MASGLSSPLGIAGVIFIVVGIIMAVIGIILLIANQNKPKGWYIWFLIIAGIIIGIAGGIMLAIALMQSPYPVECAPSCETPVQEVTRKVRYVEVAQPAPTTKIQYVEVAQPAPTTKVQYVEVAKPAPTTKVQYVEVAKPVPKVRYVAVEEPRAAPPPPETKVVRTEKIGQETFDPDPQTYVYETPQQVERIKAVGPYGVGGTQVEVTGQHKIPGARYYVTSDIPEHVVVSK